MTKRDDHDGSVIVHVGERGAGGSIKLARVGAMIGSGRRHVDIAFAFKNSGRGDKDGYRWECMSRTQAQVLVREILKAAK